MALEGELHVGLRLDPGRIASVHIGSTRPDVASALLQGRSRAEVEAAVPLLFSLCGRSQATASRLACAAAAGQPPSAEQLESARASVAAEMVRETAWHALLQWPRWMDEAPSPQAVAAARGALAYRWGQPGHDALVQDLAEAAWGCPASAWLQWQTWPELRRWAQAGATATARYLHQGLISEGGADDTGAPPLLPAPEATWLRTLALAVEADPGFSRQPVWQGAPAETGALARLQADALLASPADRPAARTLPRFVARLRELALLLTGRTQPQVGAITLADGSGLAWVDNARGLLIHQVHLAGDRVQHYRIVAPTEWNFHPQGALPHALLGAAVPDAAAALRLAERLVHSLDPCVACRVELDEAG